MAATAQRCRLRLLEVASSCVCLECSPTFATFSPTPSPTLTPTFSPADTGRTGVPSVQPTQAPTLLPTQVPTPFPPSLPRVSLSTLSHVHFADLQCFLLLLVEALLCAVSAADDRAADFNGTADRAACQRPNRRTHSATSDGITHHQDADVRFASIHVPHRTSATRVVPLRRLVHAAATSLRA